MKCKLRKHVNTEDHNLLLTLQTPVENTVPVVPLEPSVMSYDFHQQMEDSPVVMDL